VRFHKRASQCLHLIANFSAPSSSCRSVIALPQEGQAFRSGILTTGSVSAVLAAQYTPIRVADDAESDPAS
jgi:hypothetical protein